MKLGAVGLGRMGANMSARLLDAGHAVVPGGVWGKERGYCQMIGDDADVVERDGRTYDLLGNAGPRRAS